jgi:hypothetical protein
MRGRTVKEARGRSGVMSTDHFLVNWRMDHIRERIWN